MSAPGAQELMAADPKEVFGWAMGEVAENDELLSVVVSDYGRRLSLERMRELRPEGFVQVGIAEQNQIEVAAALALEGLHVVVPAYACFLATRDLDQIRICVGSMGAPLVLVGLSGGFASGILGASHMALTDIALMRTIPDLEIVCPANNVELYDALVDLAQHPRACYIRMTHATQPQSVPTQHRWPARWYVVSADSAPAQQRARVGIIACGTLVTRAAAAADLLRAQGVTCDVVSMTSVWPLDSLALDALFGTDLIVTVEEHRASGGLGGACAEYLAQANKSPRLLCLGAPANELAADDHNVLLMRSGLESESIATSILQRLAQMAL